MLLPIILSGSSGIKLWQVQRETYPKSFGSGSPTYENRRSVARSLEKPFVKLAQSFWPRECLWNSGISCFTVSMFLDRNVLDAARSQAQSANAHTGSQWRKMEQRLSVQVTYVKLAGSFGDVGVFSRSWFKDANHREAWHVAH